MGYLDSKGLQHAAWVTKNQTAQNWQMTKSKEAVTFYPAPQTELEPIVDFMFTETPPASGTKGLDNPSTIAGVSSINANLVEKNILSLPYSNGSYLSQGGITYSVDKFGEITINGTSTSYSYFHLFGKDDPDTISVPSGLYTIIAPKAPGVSLVLSTENDTVFKFVHDGINDVVTVSDSTLAHVYIRVDQNVVVDNYKFKPAVYYSKLDEQNNYSISLDNTYYGGSLNVKTGELTVTHKMYAFTGNEAGWSNDGNGGLHSYNSNTKIGFTQLLFNNYITEKAESVNSTCTHLPYISSNETLVQDGTRKSPCYCLVGENAQLRFLVPFSTISDFREWLTNLYNAGTPVCITYKLKVPLTVQLTPQQILSLPQEDKYVPRINTVYTDQKSVRVGYRRLDCIELRSDQTVHGEKTFADSPLVPNPDDLDSQQAAPISFVKDMLRAEVEAMSGGKNTIIRDQWNNPHVMVRIPKFLLKDIDSSWPNEPHPAFIVNGVQKSEIFIGKYLASQSSAGKVQTLPRQAPWTQINFDNALNSCRSLGPGFCLNTNASWAARALWLYKTLGGSHEYLGNGNFGRDYTYHELTGTMKDSSYIPGNTSITDAVTLTGSGGIKWNDDETAYGIADFVGNVLEWIAGFRLNNGEIQIIQDNNACLSTCDMSASSIEWKAILQDGSFVSPETANTLKYDGSVADATTSWNVAGTFRLNTEIINQNIKGYYGALDFKNMIAYSGVIVPNILKQLAIFPISNVLQGYCWACNKTERFLGRGGGAQNNHPYCGPFAFSFNNARTYTARTYGFRTAYIA